MGRPKLENKKSRKEIQKDYREKHKKELLEKNKKYRETPEGKKTNIKNKWKSRGLDMDTFYYVYPIYLNTTHCDSCNVLLTNNNSGTQKCMDHCHATGMFRNIICKNCNVKIPNINKNLL